MTVRALSVALVAGCALACGSPDRPDAREELLDVDRAFAAATAAEGIDGWVRYFAPDGSQFRSGGLATGHDAVREFMTPAFADSTFTLTWSPTGAQVARSGELGYTIGRWRSRRMTRDGERERTGSYLTVWKRQPDGAWRVLLDTGSPDE